MLLTVFTIYSSSNNSMGNWKMVTLSKVACDSIAKLVNFHVLQQFVGVSNLRVAISNELHTRKIKLIDAYSPESDDPRKCKHRKKQKSSETERERD